MPAVTSVKTQKEETRIVAEKSTIKNLFSLSTREIF